MFWKNKCRSNKCLYGLYFFETIVDLQSILLRILYSVDIIARPILTTFRQKLDNIFFNLIPITLLKIKLIETSALIIKAG